MFTTVENFLTNFSFLALFLGMLLYWIEISNYTNSDSVSGVRKEQNNVLTSIGSSTGVSSFTTGALNQSQQKLSFTQISVITANLLIFILLLLRWKESGHFPLSNLYESLMFLSWTLTTIHLFLEFNLFKSIQFSNNETQFSNKNYVFAKLLGAVTTPSALFTNAFATFSLPKEMQESSPLVPALQSNWLMMHVTVMILSYGALICGSLLAIAFLVITGGNELSTNKSNNLNLISTKGGNSSSGELSPSEFKNVNLANIPTVQNSSNLKNLEKLALTFDNLSYRILGIGFPLLTIGILSGAVWANEAWGSYWSWDPKETWALLTWFVFAIYLHMRLNKGWQGKKPALIAALGFIFVWVCYLGVNLLGEGLHSYGWFNN